jgi:release factor glutamine methyltransferase
MLTYSQAFYGLKNKLQTLYDEREAGAISHEILEHITGLGKMQRILKKDTLLNEMMQEQYCNMFPVRHGLWVRPIL